MWSTLQAHAFNSQVSDRVNVLALQLRPAVEEGELDEEREPDDRAAEPFDQPRGRRRRCRRWRARRRRSAPARPGATASRWISSRSVPYSSSYSSRSISHGSLPALRTGTKPAPALGTRAAPRTRSPRASMPRTLSIGSSANGAASASIGSREGVGCREQRRDVAEDDARLGPVGDVAHELPAGAPSPPDPGYRRGASPAGASRRPTCACGGAAGAARGWIVRAVVGAPDRGRTRRSPSAAARGSRLLVVGRRPRRPGTTRRRRRAAASDAALPALVQRAVLRLALLPPRQQRRGDEDRRVRTDEQTGGEREREVLERRRAEDSRADDQQRQHRHQRDERRRQRAHQHLVERAVDHLAVGGAAGGGERPLVLPHLVEHDDGVVEREPENGEERGDRRRRDLEVEQRVHADA